MNCPARKGDRAKTKLQVTCELLALVLLLAAGTAAAGDLPNPQLTPGDILTTDTKVICRPGYTKTVRDVPQALKAQVYRQYGVLSHQPREYEIDHLVSLELGGSNSIRNLWPQSYVTQPLNARVKDRLENKLHGLICSGALPVEQAQRGIAQDWTKAYVQYIGPLPSGPGSSGTAPAGDGASGECPPAAPIKVSKAGIYHLPRDPVYARTRAKACFASTEAAKAAGYRAPRRYKERERRDTIHQRPPG